MRLLFRPQPMPDEWIGSWIVRLSAANNATFPATPQILLKTLGINTAETQLADNQLNLLSAATGVDLTVLQALNTMPASLIPHNGRKHSDLAIPIPFLGVRYLVACPDCLIDDREPYFRRIWLSDSTIACPTHGGPIYATCPHCDARLGVPMSPVSNFKRRRAPSGIPQRPTLDSRQCWKCYGDLAAKFSPLEPLPPDLEPVGYRFSSKVKGDPQAWTAFVRGLRTYLRTYNLPQLIDPGQFKVDPTPSPQVDSYMTIEARFRTERLLAWLLIPTNDRVLNPYRQLQLMAGTLVGYLNSMLRPDSSRRWLHIAWLSTRLLQDMPRIILKVWPDQVSALVSLFEKRWTDPRMIPDPTFRLHEEPWRMMAPFLVSELAVCPPLKRAGTVLTQEENRIIMNAILQNFAGARLSDTSSFGLERTLLHDWRINWKEDGRLGLALGQLHRSVLNYRFRLLNKRGKEPDWVESAAAMLMTDNCIELTRTVNPALHRELFLELIRALKQHNS